MTWKRVTAYKPGCDGCGWKCWDGIDAAPLYESLAEARADLADRYEWQIVRTIDGIRMYCDGCASAQECDVLGHTWAPPVTSDIDPAVALLPDACTRCFTTRAVDAPEGTHPESMTAADDAWLAQVDADLFPEGRA